MQSSNAEMQTSFLTGLACCPAGPCLCRPEPSDRGHLALGGVPHTISIAAARKHCSACGNHESACYLHGGSGQLKAARRLLVGPCHNVSCPSYQRGTIPDHAGPHYAPQLPPSKHFPRTGLDR